MKEVSISQSIILFIFHAIGWMNIFDECKMEHLSPFRNGSGGKNKGLVEIVCSNNSMKMFQATRAIVPTYKMGTSVPNF